MRKSIRPTFKSPERLWDPDNPPELVISYLDAHRGEVDTDDVYSDYPYSGPASRRFVLITRESPRPYLHTFEEHGEGGWRVANESIANRLTADLFAAAQLLGGSAKSEGISGPPGGFGVDISRRWISLLDGGIGLELQLYQDEYTNEVSGKQRVVIKGPFAYRTLLTLLGFGWSLCPLPGEISAPKRDDVFRQIQDLLSGAAGKTK